MSKCPHIDLVNPDSYKNGVPNHWLAELRHNEPVYWHDDPASGVGFWVITRYDDLEFVSKNPQLFSSWERSCLFTEPTEEALAGLRLMMLNMDPPQHLQYRRVVNKAFIPKVVEAQLKHIHALAKSIVEGVAKKGRCEFVSEVAAELPLQVICELMGVAHEDRHMIYQNTNIMIGADDPDMSTTPEEGQIAAIEIYAYGMKLLEQHKANPGQTLTGMLIDGTVDGESLTEDEFCSFFLLLLVAGNETTRTVTTNGMRLLIQHPDQLQKLVDNPKLIPNAVEEMLRFDPAVIQFRRTATEDVELRGALIKKGDKVVMYYHSANRDEALFSHPDEFNVLRDNAKEHRAFGIGEHYCLGAHLARLELNVMFNEIVPKLRNPRIVGQVDRLRSNFINGTKSMYIEFDGA